VTRQAVVARGADADGGMVRAEGFEPPTPAV
jgi:hypothetical protein